jgi:putative glutamine amidotransferase
LPGNLEPLVYSSHHQAVKQVGKGIEVTALSPDGKVVEGIAHSHYQNVFAVQFHPEVPSLYKNHQKLKFSPSDRPETLHSLMDRKSLMFHRKYWQHISSILNSNSKQIK